MNPGSSSRNKPGVPDGDHARLTFQFRPCRRKSGLAFYRFSVAPSGASTRETAEATAATTRGWWWWTVGGDPHRILYVTGRPNWEFKFLNRALAEDSCVQLVGLIPGGAAGAKV